MTSIFNRLCNKICDKDIRLFYNDEFSFQAHRIFSSFVENKIFTCQFIEVNGKKEVDFTQSVSDFMNQFKKHLQEQLQYVNSTCNHNDQSNAVYREYIGQFLKKIPTVSGYSYQHMFAV